MTLQQTILICLVQFGCPPVQADHADQLPAWLADRNFAAKLKVAAAKGSAAGFCDRNTAMFRAKAKLDAWLERYGY